MPDSRQYTEKYWTGNGISKTLKEKLVARALRGHQTQMNPIAEPYTENGLPCVGQHMAKSSLVRQNHLAPNCQGRA